MKKAYTSFLLFVLLTAVSSSVEAQNLNGQWRGGFISAGGYLDRETEYVLDLEINGKQIGGFSYTYFIINGKRCYVICRLKGVYDKASKSVTVTEYEKVKSNTPPDFRDCFQTHMLTFFKNGENEQLKGTWKPATPKDNCGIGETELERKVLVKITPPKTNSQTSVAQNKNNVKPPVTAKTNPPVTKQNNTTTPKNNNTAKNNTTTNKTTKPDVAKNNNSASKQIKTEKPATIEKTLPEIEKPKGPPTIKSSVVRGFENRGKQVIKTIEVDSATFRVDLYDNGQIDGDTVSLFFNGALVVSKQRLSAKPITLKIKIDPGKNDNDLVMYAENLGSIPPNTSLMVVTIGDKRYEVNITSTEQTSGTVRFKLKEDAAALR
jgi:hypothetical protein